MTGGTHRRARPLVLLLRPAPRWGSIPTGGGGERGAPPAPQLARALPRRQSPVGPRSLGGPSRTTKGAVRPSEGASRARAPGPPAGSALRPHSAQAQGTGGPRAPTSGSRPGVGRSLRAHVVGYSWNRTSRTVLPSDVGAHARGDTLARKERAVPGCVVAASSRTRLTVARA